MITITCDSRAPIAQLFGIKLQGIICDLNSPAPTDYPRNRITSDLTNGFTLLQALPGRFTTNLGKEDRDQKLEK